ncbi:MAG: hypothetical protein DRR16_22315 [Candidatus Parabeggiatoa sp. nov. 3]|nr:MAG: hypothetical protein DRR00_15755 [Gammaproteobacteria bacterium]RKZ65675.1 MAG: hypothetical protein DRQ99_11970 [Gammaproteobacteria bacterium]RKZ81342.1 MAG: hypothetical protein DRR16_22315 [Gammaproteobacteria bacterium]
MKTILSKRRYATVFLTLSLVSSAVAFEDIYEPDNQFEQAKEIYPNHPQQHTLHSVKDVDWFKIYAEKLRYQIAVKRVGSDIDVVFEIYNSEGTLLGEEVDAYSEGEEEFTNWTAPSDGIYYIKIHDMVESLKEGHCRINMQYELHYKLHDETAELPWQIRGVVTDKLSGNSIQGAMVESNCNRQAYSGERGEYRLNSCSFPNGTYALTVTKPGYQTLSCHFPATGLTLITRQLSLIPASRSHEIQPIAKSDHTLQASQKEGRFKVALPLFPLPEDECVLYYLAIQYPEPDNRLFIIRDFNQLVEVKSNVMPHWIGVGYPNPAKDAQVVIDKPVNEMPRGEYKLYLLRMPGYVEEPLKHLDLGELKVTTFNVE